MSKVNERVFETLNGFALIVANRKSAVIFEILDDLEEKYKFILEFSDEVFIDLLEHLETVSNQSWPNIDPKDATSEGADYWEYYDREFDNNGYLSVSKNVLRVERPWLESNRLYQFNKKKMESFIYDFRKLV